MMIDLIIEINGYKQLKKIEKGMISSLMDDLDRLFSPLHPKSAGHVGGGFLYRFSPGKRELRILIETVYRAWTQLDSFGEDLRGYNMLLLEDEKTGDEELADWLDRKLMAISRDRTFLLSPELVSRFQAYVQLRECDDFFICEGLLDGSGEIERHIGDFLDAHPMMEGLVDRFEPFLNGQVRGMLCLTGPEGSGKRHAVSYLERQILGKEQASFLTLVPTDALSAPGVPLLEAIRDRGLEHCESFLEGTGLRLWRSLAPLLELCPETVCFEDAVLLFGLYLQSYIAEMESRLLPPLLIVYRIDAFRGETVNAIASFVKEHEERGCLNALVTSRRESMEAPFAPIHMDFFRCELWPQRELSRLLPRELYDGADLSLQVHAVSLYHTALLLKRGVGFFSGMQATKRMVRDLNRLEAKMLFLFTLCEGLFDADELRREFPFDRVERGEYMSVLSDLVEVGLLKGDGSLKPVYPELAPFLSRQLGEEGAALEQLFGDLLMARQRSGDERCEQLAQRWFRHRSGSVQAIYWLLSRLERLISRGKISLAAPFFEDASLAVRRLESQQVELRDYLDALYLSSSLCEGRDRLAGEIAGRFSERPEPLDTKIRSTRRLALAEYLLSVHSYRKAMDPAKSALLELQESELRNGEAYANLLLGRILLAMDRIDEARDYFTIARETAFPPGEVDRSAQLAAHLALVHFIEGNFTASYREAELSLCAALETGDRDMEIYARFIRGRIDFMLGRYPEAEEVFTSLLNLALVYGKEDVEEVCVGWAWRSMVYQGKLQPAMHRLSDSPENPEHQFFYAEACFLNEEYGEALRAIEEAARLERDRVKLFAVPVPWNWESGFACFEDLMLASPGRHGTLYQLIRAWYGLILSRNNQLEEGRQELWRLTREEQLSEHDPYSHLYIFFQTLAFPPDKSEGQGEGLDELTQLSKALRFVQGLGSRVEKPIDRQDYLNRNYWNAKLTARGREAKLI